MNTEFLKAQLYLSISYSAAKDIYFNLTGSSKALHPLEFQRSGIKTEVAFGNQFVVVFMQTGILVCDNTSTFAFQTQQHCIFQLMGMTAKKSLFQQVENFSVFLCLCSFKMYLKSTLFAFHTNMRVTEILQHYQLIYMHFIIK